MPHHPYNQVELAILDLANGNRDALTILRNVVSFGVHVNVVLQNLEAAELRGFYITYGFKATRESLTAFINQLESSSGVAKLKRHVDQAKHFYLPVIPPFKIRRILREARYDSLVEALDARDVNVIRSALDYTSINEMYSDDEVVISAIHDFLIPDRVDPAEWFLVMTCLVNPTFLFDFEDHVSNASKWVLDTAFSETRFPMWFRAGYPQVVKWALQGGSLGSVTAEFVADYNSESDSDTKYAGPLLRMMITDFSECNRASSFR